jgi:branched-chain amino acid transport system ATP-binding protein
MLEARDLHVRYGAVEAVRGVTLRAQPGEVTALIGANGAGKSSLLAALSGLVAPSAGSVLLDGRDLAGLPTHERARLGISHAPEGRRLFHQQTVQENLVLAWHFRRSGGELGEALDRVYARFGALAGRRHVRAGTLSGGQQQMLILSMATIHAPRVLLLDEPSLGLAPILVSQVLDFIRRYAAEGDRVVLVSEQMASLALQVADHGYVLRQGRVVLEGRREALLAGGRPERLSTVYLGTDRR